MCQCKKIIKTITYLTPGIKDNRGYIWYATKEDAIKGEIAHEARYAEWPLDCLSYKESQQIKKPYEIFDVYETIELTNIHETAIYKNKKFEEKI